MLIIPKLDAMCVCVWGGGGGGAEKEKKNVKKSVCILCNYYLLHFTKSSERGKINFIFHETDIFTHETVYVFNNLFPVLS